MADLGKVTGTITSLEMVGGTVGAIVSGILFDATGSFASTWIVCLACSVVMLVFLFVRHIKILLFRQSKHCDVRSAALHISFDNCCFLKYNVSITEHFVL